MRDKVLKVVRPIGDGCDECGKHIKPNGTALVTVDASEYKQAIERVSSWKHDNANETEAEYNTRLLTDGGLYHSKMVCSRKCLNA
jgi:hypothetical protein